MKRELAIVGGGVSGFACGLKLLEAGFDVTIVARDLPPHTTSDVAAAFWYPDGAFPAERVRQWATVSHQEFLKIGEMPGSGVSLKPLVELYREPTGPPGWFDLVQAVETAVYPPNYHGYRVLVPAIDTPIYMPFLQQRFLALGGVVVRRTIANLTALLSRYSVVVNCAGVWAGDLAGDTAVTPVRGQIIRVRKPAGLPDEIVHMDAAEYSTYIVPRSQDCVLGGSKQKGDWQLAVDPALARNIMARCVALQPLLQGADVLEHRVGLRPGRPEVRLELEDMGEGTAVIHNYGHGSIGHTLAWGCAAEVAALTEAFL